MNINPQQKIVKIQQRKTPKNKKLRIYYDMQKSMRRNRDKT